MSDCDVLEDLHSEMFEAWWSLRDSNLHMAGPMGGPRRLLGTAWMTGYASQDACLAESRTDDGVQYLGKPWDDGFADLAAIEGERAGMGVRWIMTDWAGLCDHLLPECPAVRRRRRSAQWGRGLVDPLGEDLCGWCQRVWKARNQ